MINQKYIDLMNQELDGANSPEQSRELDRHLASNPEARAYYRELAQALGLFEKVEMLDPPPGLDRKILARVDEGTGQEMDSPPPENGRGWLAACRDLLSLRLRPAYAYTFVAGAMFGLLLFAASSWLTSRHDTDLYGDVRGTANHRPWDLDEVSEGELTLPGIAGFYRAMREGQDFRLRLNLRSEQPAVIKFSHGPGTTLQHYNSSNPAPANLTVSEHLVELNHRGRGSYDLVFHGDTDEGNPIKMLVFSEGRLVKTETLEKQEQ